ncbi:DNA/RNA non-specific endonuclease (plasmid) [Cupriavidus pauculus]|uniref:Endonuclease n=1 Tax=Cupriavidus pauculus TaxID=82633 RepID=A0A5P2H7U3_9BURK|nr:DNA/RNA non-specific endonuclease [Cupriavidus pauculus]QET04046.1 DNA/RNA non-specific endonuclease [Cupriavidus pauculus]
MFRRPLLIFALALTAANASGKESASCAHVLESGQPAVHRSAAESQLLCYRAFAVLYSGQTRTALWSAERLTGAAADAARSLPRDSDFYEEARVPPADRAKLKDYARSGMDRGHLAPSGDFPDKASQAESFSLANVVPQDRDSNRRTWSHIETSTRRLARQYGVIHVVTGPAFTRDSPTLNGRIRIPAFLWKAIYVPGLGAAAYVVRNDATPAYSVTSIEELAQFSGIDPFPALARSQRAAAIDLPPPAPHPGERAARRVPFAALVSSGTTDVGSNISLDALAARAGALAGRVTAYLK